MRLTDISGSWVMPEPLASRAGGGDDARVTQGESMGDDRPEPPPTGNPEPKAGDAASGGERARVMAGTSEGSGAASEDPVADTDPEVANLLDRLGDGDDAAGEKLLSLLYDELHQRALLYMKKQPSDHTLQATALVHEAFIRMLGSSNRKWQNRTHFLAVAAKAMRSVLVDHARAKKRQKRETPGRKLSLDQIVLSYEDMAVDLVDLDSALEKLAKFDPRMARAVELRFFGGLSIDETAAILGMAKRTFERNWTATRAWLKAEVS